MLDRKQYSRACLKVHVVWCRRAAFRTVIDDEVTNQSYRKVQHVSELVCDALRAVFSMSYRQVMIHDWKWIAVDREVLIEWKTFFFRRKIRRA